ncbi:hypothetical protein JHK85_000759 [Glycine max]|uniref:Retrotransposon Copia-like N-terminal domain-containing protein n=1 Tax=Glycine max TaxID=3847 RepID=A0A0R0L7K9_SOYBN|nr:hypothetical protein JHK85_000759 [Glycine max]KAG5088127.1 hypothetical protein JHK86_000739 [Glycine max]KAH1161994.1 hypothetical protein GYH30_000740 [Glycine max]
MAEDHSSPGVPVAVATGSPGVATRIEFESNPNQQLSSIVLNEFNYLPWSRVLTLAFGGRSKLSFIDEKVSPPDETSLDDESWLSKDELVQSWILNSTSPHLAEIFSYPNSVVQLLTTVRDILKRMWNELEVYRPHILDVAILRKGVEEDIIFQLLASPDPEYEDLRSHILMSPELPSL